MGWNTADRPNGVVFLLVVYYFDICSEHGIASRLSDWNSSCVLGEDQHSDFGWRLDYFRFS